MISPDLRTLRSQGLGVQRGHPKLESSLTYPRMMMLGSTSTPITGHSQTRLVSMAPKIQRLVTPQTLQRKRARIAEKKRRVAKVKSEAAEYQKLLASRLKEQGDPRSESLAKRLSRLSAASKPSIAD